MCLCLTFNVGSIEVDFRGAAQGNIVSTEYRNRAVVDIMRPVAAVNVNHHPVLYRFGSATSTDGRFLPLVIGLRQFPRYVMELSTIDSCIAITGHLNRIPAIKDL